jgi:hypothetical protein
VNRRHAFVIGGIAVASVTIAVLSYYFFMSAWVYVEVSPGRHDVEIVNLTDNDIAHYPTLQRLMLKADESRGIVPSRAIEQISRIQANEIANLLEMRTEGSDVDGAFAYNDTIYRVHLFYQYNAPGIL